MNAPLENVDEVLPLSPTQGGMLFEALSNNENAYNAVVQARLCGPLDPEKLVAAFKAEIASLDVLRACFIWENLQQPVQVIRRNVALRFEICKGDPEAHLAAAREEVFDLTQAPLMSLRLVEEAPESFVLIWACHHIISDGWSSRIILERVLRRLAGKDPGPQRPFKAHLRWLAERDREADIAFWRASLNGLEAPCTLPLHGETHEEGHKFLSHKLPGALSQKCRDAAASARVTMATLLGIAWAVTLSRLTGQSDVLFGEVHAGRPAHIAGIDAAAGPYVTTVPARFDLGAAAKYLDLLEAAETQARARQKHAHLGLAAALKVGNCQDQSYFDTLFSVQSFPDFENHGAFRLEGIVAENPTSFPFSLLVTLGDTTELIAAYEAHRVSTMAATDILARYERVLEGMVADLDSSPDAIHDQTQSPIPSGPDFKALPGQISDTAVAHGDREALVFGDQRMSYRELDGRAKGVAAALRAQGIGRGDIVPVVTKRGLEAVAGMLGVLYAGAAYAPLDASYPEERIALVLGLLAPRVMLVEGSDFDASCPVLRIGDIAPSSAELAEVSASDLAYVIFTSGSSGTPKGVKINHGNLSWSNNARDGVYGEPPSSFLHLSSFAFDSSIVGLYWTLAAGGKLVISEPRAEQDMAGLIALAQREQVSHLLCLPGLYDRMLDGMNAESTDLETVILAGEELSEELIARHRVNNPAVRLFNEYGPTEASVWCAAFDTKAHVQGAVPIGKAPGGASTEVCDAAVQPLPQGFEGEIIVSGAGVSPGYLGLENETKAAFMLSNNGVRRYRTGDRGFLTSDGNIVFLGRMDEQVKIRGHRVEPNEIASVLRTIAGGHAAVAVSRDGQLPRLIAAVVSDRSADEIHNALAKKVAPYMMPAEVLALDRLPSLPNGKTDLAAIAKLASPNRKPTGITSGFYQERLAQVWSETFKREIDGNTNFFEAGGDSLQSITVLGRAKKLGLNLMPGDIFAFPVLKDLAQLLADRDAEPIILPEDYRLIASAHPSGSKTPFFMLHGSSEMYTSLLKELGPDRPVAFSFAAYHGGLIPLGQSIQDMAAEAMRALKIWRPEGPYLIGGYSVGGPIAIELAHRLRAAGDEVEELVLLDPSYLTAPPEGTREPFKHLLKRTLSGLRGWVTGLGYLARLKMLGREQDRLRFTGHAYRFSLSRCRPPIYSGSAHVMWSKDSKKQAYGIRVALTNHQAEDLPFEHLDFLKKPEAMAAWSQRLYTILQGT